MGTTNKPTPSELLVGGPYQARCLDSRMWTPPLSWREYSDRLHQLWLTRWLGNRRFERVLKTDLYDESQSSGLLPWLARFCHEAWGIDVDARVIERARGRLAATSTGIQIRRGDVRALEFKDASFDLIVSNSTLDHFDRPGDLERAIGELCRLLRPAGTLVLTLDNPANPVVWLRNRIHIPDWMTRIGAVPYPVGHTLTMSELERQVVSHGLQVKHRAYFGHVPRSPAVHLCRLADRLSPAYRQSWLNWLLGWEERAWVPPLSGYFLAVVAHKPG